jgi:hypothetical protein
MSPVDQFMSGLDRESFTVILWGSVRGKVVASIAQAFCLVEHKLALAPATENAPWRIEGKKQDYFMWRKAMAEERAMLYRTLADLFKGQPVMPGKINWPFVNGRTVYNRELATNVAQDYAKVVVKALGLTS